jgi:DNA (cytosine-5)-methyltransferase 1
MKVLDTFAGAGGFSLGFSLSKGYEVIGAIEIDKWASETFSYNHPYTKTLVGDIQNFSDEQILSTFGNDTPDIILGGPPCQGYSICNKNAGDPTDPRNTLFNEFVRIGRLLKPSIMIMENVPNITKAKTHTGELVTAIIRGELEKLGYHVYQSVLNATEYGVPQIRRRFIVVASMTPLTEPFPAPTHSITGGSASLFEKGLKKCPTLWDAISDMPPIEACEGAEQMAYESDPKNEYQHYLREHSDNVYNHKAMMHSKRMVERFSAMSWGDSTSDLPEHLRPLRRSGKGEISEKVYDQNNRRMHPNKPCHTIAASFYANFVHPYINRNFTPREGARIQSFPDWYVFKGKPTVVSHKLLHREGRDEEKHLCQYNQIGNAVPPLLAKAIADNLHNQLVSKELECTFTETI